MMARPFGLVPFQLPAQDAPDAEHRLTGSGFGHVAARHPDFHGAGLVLRRAPHTGGAGFVLGSDPHAFAASARRMSQLRGVKLICPGHEDIISDANWLSELADMMDAALSGKAQSSAVNQQMKRKQFNFGAFSVWFPL